ncbi:MAG: IclR family transcriptional regulator [Rhizobiales bacterium]|nr:IclR family transcriptional regulator [Hyphomicrobiales bacterium]
MDKTLLKGLQVLEFLAEAGGELTLAEITDITGLQKSNAHRVLQTFVHAGYVSPGSQRGAYKLSLKLWQLGNHVIERNDFRTAARPAMELLSRQTGHTVLLATLDGMEAVYIDKIDAVKPYGAISKIGGRIPIHSTSLGKVLLAHDATGLIDRLSYPLKRFSKQTITSRSGLKKELTQICECGYSVNRGESTAPIWSVAAPIYDARGRAYVAVSIAWPELESRKKPESKYVPLVLEAARGISSSLGYTPCRATGTTALPKPLSRRGQVSAIAGRLNEPN